MRVNDPRITKEKVLEKLGNSLPHWVIVEGLASWMFGSDGGYTRIVLKPHITQLELEKLYHKLDKESH
jgi:hypothetical protein